MSQTVGFDLVPTMMVGGLPTTILPLCPLGDGHQPPYQVPVSPSEDFQERPTNDNQMIDSNDNLSVALVEMRILKLLRKEQMTKADVNDELNSVFDACAGDPNPPVRVFH